MHTLKPLFLGVLLGSFFVGAPQSLADHIPEGDIKTVYLAINIPVCKNAPKNKTMKPDCKTPVPSVFECWKSKIHMDYDPAMLSVLLAEVKKSNQRYQYFNEPFYNELLSNRNWENLMDYSDRC